MKTMTSPSDRVDLSDPVLNFGKYKGWKESRVAEHDPRYFLWAATNVEWFNPSEVLIKQARLKCPRRLIYLMGDPAEEDEDDWI